MSNRTFTMVKPDAFASGHTGSIIKHIEAAGFKIIAMKLTKLSAEKAGELYDKLFGFVETMDDLGSGIKKASDSFEKAMGQLSTGRGNAIKKAEELKILGADTKKQFPDRLIDNYNT